MHAMRNTYENVQSVAFKCNWWNILWDWSYQKSCLAHYRANIFVRHSGGVSENMYRSIVQFTLPGMSFQNMLIFLMPVHSGLLYLHGSPDPRQFRLIKQRCKRGIFSFMSRWIQSEAPVTILNKCQSATETCGAIIVHRDPSRCSKISKLLEISYRIRIFHDFKKHRIARKLYIR